MRIAALAASFVFLAAATSPGQCGPITDHAALAERLIEENDPVGAVAALDAAIEEVWKRSPLIFRKSLFVEDSAGFGIYRERDSEIFKPGEPLVVYAEPIGFAYGKNAIGGMEINLVADFVLTDRDGKTLFSKDDFLNVALPVRYHNREFQMKLTVNLTGLPAGKYIARFNVRDHHSDKSGMFELPFEVAG